MQDYTYPSLTIFIIKQRNTPLAATASPFNKQTPVKKLAASESRHNTTPGRGGSPYSPASKVSHQHTIKKLTKLLEDSSKALEKKTALVVTKNNRVTHLEAQVNALEKKQGIKELTAVKSDLQADVTRLETEVFLQFNFLLKCHVQTQKPKVEHQTFDEFLRAT